MTGGGAGIGEVGVCCGESPSVVLMMLSLGKSVWEQVLVVTVISR